MELHSREAELTEAMSAMSQVLDFVEGGQAEVEDDKLRMLKWPDFFRRMADRSTDGAPLSSLINLVRPFVRLVLRGQETEQGAEVRHDEPSQGSVKLDRKWSVAAGQHGRIGKAWPPIPAA